MLDQLIVAGMSFGRNCIGLILKPYETMRRIVQKGTAWELLYVAIPLALYFAIASIVKTAAFRPFLLTKQFMVLGLAAGLSYGVSLVLFLTVGRIIGANIRQKGLAIAWGYTLIPTVCWFFATSLLYVIIPPPRTESIWGILFSALYLIFSATLLSWKIILGYLAIRFGMRLPLGKILIISASVLPLLGLYSVMMYRLGIFRIPFL
jgi:Yip1 domain